MDISVVIPNYNGGRLLSDLPKILKILETYSHGEKELIIADDASKDKSLKFLKIFAKDNNRSSVKILLLENVSGKNKGFAINVNKGVAKASGEIIILLNTDVVPHSDFLTYLLPHFKSENVFAVGCLDESMENGNIILRGRGVGSWQRGFLIHSRGDIHSSSTLWVSCGSGAFRKSIWDKLGGLNELYSPFYWEDIDLSYRAQKAGYAVMFEGKSIVRHEHETGSIKKNYSIWQVKKIAYRNQFYFTWLNATDTMILIAHVCFLPIFILKAMQKKDSAFFLGFFLAILSLPKVLRERKKVQSLVKKSDREVIYT